MRASRSFMDRCSKRPRFPSGSGRFLKGVGECFLEIQALNRLELETKAWSIGRPHVDSLGAARDLVLFLELGVHLFRAARGRKEHFAPGSVVAGEYKMGGAAAPAAVRYDRNLLRSSERVDPAKLGEPAAPVH